MLKQIGQFFTRLLRLVLYRVAPTLVIIVVFWSGYGVATAAFRQLEERAQYQDVNRSFAISASNIEIAWTATGWPTTSIITSIPTPEPTNTFESTVAASSTSAPTPTETLLPATSTLTSTIDVTNTPEASMTPQGLPEARIGRQATNTVQPFMFATNTPRPLEFATNTPLSELHPVTSTEQPQSAVTPTELVSSLESATESLPTSQPEVMQPTPTNTLPPFYYPRTPQPGTTINGISVPTEVPLIPREFNLFNVILLGGDDELTNDGSIRTDTMIIVSINKDTNTASMLSLPRDLYVYVPTENGAMERLNTVYGLAESLSWQPEPFDLLRQTIAYNFGINVHHYALVNFSGFEQLIDTLGGINIAVDCAYQDYRLIGAELPTGAMQSAQDDDLFTVDIGYYEMSGGEALWYARTRRTATDFDRGRRQQQILRAMFKKALDTGQIRNLPQIWGQVSEVLQTSVDVTDMFGLVPIALELDPSAIRSYTLTVGYHTQGISITGSDGVTANVHIPVFETLRPLLEEFYRPPANSQITLEGATIAVFNGTENSNLDIVATERLGWEGFRAVALGEADVRDIMQTQVIDHTGQQKGSSLDRIAAILNVNSGNVTIDPQSDRIADFEIILGSDYNSCTYDGILAVDE